MHDDFINSCVVTQDSIIATSGTALNLLLFLRLKCSEQMIAPVKKPTSRRRLCELFSVSLLPVLTFVGGSPIHI